jgi:GNAT superfamily N-acetyltransferase
MGQYRPDAIPDDWIWAEFWTRYYTDVEPQHTWVAQDGGGVAGYITATTDAGRADAYTLRVLPGIIWHVLQRRLLREPAARRAIACMVRSQLAGELRLPPGVARECPATAHINLLERARGTGVGRCLFETFISRMRLLGVGGLHAQTVSLNLRVDRFLSKLGMRLLASEPLTSFAHVAPGPMYLQTWVMRL